MKARSNQVRTKKSYRGRGCPISIPRSWVQFTQTQSASPGPFLGHIQILGKFKDLHKGSFKYLQQPQNSRSNNDRLGLLTILSLDWSQKKSSIRCMSLFNFYLRLLATFFLDWLQKGSSFATIMYWMPLLNFQPQNVSFL